MDAVPPVHEPPSEGRAGGAPGCHAGRPATGVTGARRHERSVRRRARAIGGNTSTDNRPAATRAAPVTGWTAPIDTPIWLAVTMNGSEVAWRSPATTVASRPIERR